MTTDELGRFHVCAASTDDLVATASGYGARVVASTERPPTLDIVLLPAGRVTGRLLGPNGEPAVEGHVWLMRSGQMSPAGRAVAPRAFADEHGDFEIEGVHPGAYGFRARGRDLMLAEPLDIVVEAGKEAHLEARLSATGRIQGQIVSEQNEPIGGANVRAFRKVDNMATGNSTSDADGSFMLDGVTPGSHELSVMGYQVISPSEIRAGETPVRIVARANATLRGIVTDDESPTANAMVELQQRDLHRETTTAADGSFSFDRIGTGEVDVIARAGGRSGRRELRIGDGAPERIELELRASASVSGTIEYAEDGSRSGAMIVTLRAPGQMPLRAVTNASGRFVVEPIARDGTYALSVNAPDGDAFLPSPPIDEIHVEQGVATPSELTLKISRARARIAGSVVGDGHAVSDAEVSAVEGGVILATTYTNADGTFQLDSLPHGTIDLEARAGHRVARQKDVRPGEDSVLLAFPADGKIEGTIKGLQGAVHVSAIAGDRGGSIGSTWASGNKFVIMVPSGTYRVVAQNQLTAMARVTVTEGQTSRVVLDSGRGESLTVRPTPAGLVSCAAFQGDQVPIAMGTAAEGHLVLTGLPAGEIEVRCMDRHAPPRFGSARTHLPSVLPLSISLQPAD